MPIPKGRFNGRMTARWVCATVIALVAAVTARAQGERTPGEEIPIERCDRLPMVRVRIGSAELRFLVDTGATSMLNVRSVRALKEAGAKSQSKEIEVTSWSGTAATSAREVSIREFALGNHRLQGLKLPAIDLSPIGNACGGVVDGILGVDLLDRMEVTIDLKRQIASLDTASRNTSSGGAESSTNDPKAKAMYAEMDGAMHSCMAAFEQGNVGVLRECFDPEIVFYTPHGEFVGRDNVLSYLQERYFRFVPELKYCMNLHNVRVFGNALWYSYDYSIDTPKDHLTGLGFAMCHRNGQRWQMLNLHNSLAQNVATKAP